MTPAPDLVAAALRAPEALPQLLPAEWDLLIRQARHAELLGRLAAIVEARSLLADIPAGPRAHLIAARTLTAAQQRETRRELAFIAQALAPLEIAPVLLKGAAYLVSDGPASAGRAFGDVDLLVPKARLPEVEAHLMMGGWVTTHHDPYDQRYYRQWMHELPPMEHAQRHSVIDVHHAILPETARLHPDSARLLERAIAVAGPWKVLAPTDMVLHNIVHLLYNEEFSRGLRDLSDLDLMLRQFAQTPGFWTDLVQRGGELDLARPLHYGLRLASAVLGTPIPAPTLEAAARAAPHPTVDAAMHRLWRLGLHSSHASLDSVGATGARFALYLRAHWLRMPPGLLSRHLAIKSWRRLTQLWRDEPT